MLAEIYVREKLRELSRNASQPARTPSKAVPIATPAVRSLGKLLCRLGEKLEQTGIPPEPGGRSSAPRKQKLRLRQTG